MEMDKFQELASSMNREVQMKVTETDLEKEDRMNRVRNRQKEFWTRRMARDIMENVLEEVTRFRAVQGVNMMLEGVLEDVTEHAMINILYKEVLERGPAAWRRWRGR